MNGSNNYHDQAQPGAAYAGVIQSVITWSGALLSVALVLGLGVWGYRLAVRDVSGVPVVQALDGPMRVSPEDPGGRQADHQGLAVNQVTASGEAEAPAERLLLAPSQVDLAQEDAPRSALRPMPRAELREAAPQAAADPAPQAPISAPDAVAAALALAEEISQGATPVVQEQAPITAPAPVAQSAAEISPEPNPEPSPEISQDSASAAENQLIAANVPGVVASPHPAPRPDVDLAALAAARAVSVSRTAPPAATQEVASVAPGTNMVQLGAYDTPEVARAEWQRLSGRFTSLLQGKQRVVQSAVSGGRTFYRLRAVGFADLSDARRFCAALTAEKADCIPVVSR